MLREIAHKHLVLKKSLGLNALCGLNIFHASRGVMIRDNLPSREVIDKLADQVLAMYLWLFDNRQNGNTLRLEYGHIEKIFNKNSFRTSIRKLRNKGLIDYYEPEGEIVISLIGCDIL